MQRGPSLRAALCAAGLGRATEARRGPDPGDVKAFCSGCGAECGRTKGGGGAAGHIPRHWLPTRTRGHRPENDKRLLRDSLPGGKALGQAASLQAGGHRRGVRPGRHDLLGHRPALGPDLVSNPRALTWEMKEPRRAWQREHHAGEEPAEGNSAAFTIPSLSERPGNVAEHVSSSANGFSPLPPRSPRRGPLRASPRPVPAPAASTPRGGAAPSDCPCFRTCPLYVRPPRKAGAPQTRRPLAPPAGARPAGLPFLPVLTSDTVSSRGLTDPRDAAPPHTHLQGRPARRQSKLACEAPSACKSASPGPKAAASPVELSHPGPPPSPRPVISPGPGSRQPGAPESTGTA